MWVPNAFDPHDAVSMTPDAKSKSVWSGDLTESPNPRNKVVPFAGFGEASSSEAGPSQEM